VRTRNLLFASRFKKTAGNFLRSSESIVPNEARDAREQNGA
jgi:hypothetical protein